MKKNILNYNECVMSVTLIGKEKLLNLDTQKNCINTALIDHSYELSLTFTIIFCSQKNFTEDVDRT